MGSDCAWRLEEVQVITSTLTFALAYSMQKHLAGTQRSVQIVRRAEATQYQAQWVHRCHEGKGYHGDKGCIERVSADDTVVLAPTHWRARGAIGRRASL